MNNNNLPTKQLPFSVIIRSDAFQKSINNTLNDKKVANRFTANLITVVSRNPALQECDAKSIISAGLQSIDINLSLSPTLGYAYIIPFGKSAQFQVGWKGYVQLAQRTGLYKRIGVKEVHKGELQGLDDTGEEIIKFSHDFDNEEIIGYYAYFELINGFKKTQYWTIDKIKQHAQRYSASFANPKTKIKSLWTTDFDAMAKKTVIKLLLNQWGPMSLELEKAITVDQAVIDNDKVMYVDNPGYYEEPCDENDNDRKETTVNNKIDTDLTEGK